MRTQYVVQSCFNKQYPKNRVIHRFPVPTVGEKDFYRLTLTFNAFFNSGKSRNRNKNNLYCAYDKHEVTFTEHNPAYVDPIVYQIIEHENFIQFLAYIGYCRSTKKYYIET